MFFFIFIFFIDSSLLFFFLNPQFHISHYYVRSASSATNSSRLLKKGSNPDLLSTSPISLDDIYEFTHFWWNNKQKCMLNLVNFWAAHHCLGILLCLFHSVSISHKILIFKTLMHMVTHTQTHKTKLLPWSLYTVRPS